MAQQVPQHDVNHRGETYLVPSTHQQDLERRLATGNRPPKVQREGDPVLDPSLVYAPYATETTDTSGYVGVSTEYMTYADDTSKPLAADGGVFSEIERLNGAQYGVSQDPDPEVKHTIGSGSTDEVIYTATSGEAVESKKIDRAAVQAEAERVAPDLDLTRGAGAKPVEAKTDAPAVKAAPAPKPAKPQGDNK